MANAKAPEVKPTQDVTSRAGIKQAITLNTPSTQRAFRKFFEPVNANLYNLTVSLPIMSDNTELVDELLEVISGNFKSLEESLNKEIERLEIMRKEFVVTTTLEYSNPQTFDAMCTSPEAVKFLDALRLMDRVCMLLDSLWMAQVLTLRQKLDGDRRWADAIRKDSNRLRHYANQSRKGLREEQNAGAAVDEDSDALVAQPTDGKAEAEKAASPKTTDSADEKKAAKSTKVAAAKAETSATATAPPA